MMHCKNDPGTIIKTLRQRRGVSQKDLAKRLGMNELTISKYECGKIQPSYLRVEEIAGMLGYHIEIVPNE